MKIAVVGAGVSGLVAAHRLTAQGHDVFVFEASDRFGGHAQSVSLASEGVRSPIEVGFLVFNEAVCPHLSGLLAELHVPTREIGVAYEIHSPQSEMVLRGGSLRELLARPINLTVPAFYRVLPDWIRFARNARKLLQHPPTPMTLAEFFDEGAYSDAFVEQFVYPLAGAVCPLPPESLAETPLTALLGFVHNHGLLKLTGETSCRTLAEGSRGYLHRLTDRFRERIQLNCPIVAIARHEDYVLLKFSNRSRERFDRVVLAVHSDLALRLLSDPTRDERQSLETFRYAPQNVYIHVDDEPQSPSGASAVWKFQPSTNGQGGVALSYRILQIQGGDAPEHLMLTMLGADQPPPREVIRTIRFRRPVFSAESLRAQRRLGHINGRRRTYFCGSYWGTGFHEDAVRSAEQVALRVKRHAAQELAVNRLSSSL